MTESSSIEQQTGVLKTMLDGFPDMLFLGESDEDYETIPSSRKGNYSRRGEPLTPPLSLPDSFDDGEYGGGSHFKISMRGERGQKIGGNDSSSYQEISRLRSLLVERNEKFRGDLNISDNLYNELRLRSEAELSLFELAQLKSHEFTVSSRREVEKLRRNLQETSNDLISAQARSEEANAQLSRLTKKMLLDSDSAKMEIATLEERCARLALRLKDETTLRQGGEEKALQYDRQQKTLEQTAKEFSALKTLYEQQSSSLAQLTVSEGASRTAERDLERAKELLALDKAHLLQELRASEALAEQMSKNAETNAGKVVSLEMKNQALSDQLQHVQLNGSAGLEARLERETARIREAALLQVDQIKSASRDMTDRENKVLREAKEQAETIQEQLKRSIELLTTENTRLQTELVQTQSQAISDIAEVRAELKLKSFELTVLGSAMAEKMGLYRQLEAQLDITKGELHVHRQAFLRLEAESEVSNIELRTQLQAAQSRLAAYETLENDIDNAVLRVAQAGQIDSSGNSAILANDVIDKENLNNIVTELSSGNFLTTLKNMPSHPERRARQAVLLAQKVLETEKQRDELHNQLMSSKKSMLIERDAKIEAEHALKRASQPTVYLVTKLRDEEAAHQLCRSQLKDQESAIRRALQQKDKLVTDNEAIRERMRLMLQQRGEIDQLRGLLETLQAPEMSSSTSDSYNGNQAPHQLINDNSINEVTSFIRGEDGAEVIMAESPSSRMAAMSNKPALIDTGVPIIVGSNSPTPTAAHGQTSQDSRTKTPSPEQLARMTASPTDVGSNVMRGGGKWHTREEL